MSERRQLRVRLEILRTLEECGGLLVPEDALQQQAALGIQPALLLSEFKAALRDLEQQSAITAVRPALGGPLKWKITDQGRALLAEQIPA